MIVDWILALIGWWSSLSPTSLFFFATPFAVAAVGLLVSAVKQR